MSKKSSIGKSSTKRSSRSVKPSPETKEKVVLIAVAAEKLPEPLRELAEHNAEMVLKKYSLAQIAELLLHSAPPTTIQPTKRKTARKVSPSFARRSSAPPHPPILPIPDNDEDEIEEYGKNFDTFHHERYNTLFFDFLTFDEDSGMPQGWLPEATHPDRIAQIRDCWDELVGPRASLNGYDKMMSDITLLISNVVCTSAALSLNSPYLTINAEVLQKITDKFITRDGKEIHLKLSMLRKNDTDPVVIFAKNKTQAERVYRKMVAVIKSTARTTLLLIRFVKLIETNDIIDWLVREKAFSAKKLDLKRNIARDITNHLNSEISSLKVEEANIPLTAKSCKNVDALTVLLNEINRNLLKAKNGCSLSA